MTIRGSQSSRDNFGCLWGWNIEFEIAKDIFCWTVFLAKIKSRVLEISVHFSSIMSMNISHLVTYWHTWYAVTRRGRLHQLYQVDTTFVRTIHLKFSCFERSTFCLEVQRLNPPRYHSRNVANELLRQAVFARPEMITNGIALRWGKRWRYNIAIRRLCCWNIARLVIPFSDWRGALRSIDYRRPNFFAIQRIRYCNSILHNIRLVGGADANVLPLSHLRINLFVFVHLLKYKIKSSVLL